MDIFSFVLGLSIGVGACYMQQYRRDRQLQHLLDLLANGRAEQSSLPILSRLRGQIVRTKAEQQQQKVELNTWQQALEVAPIGYLQVDSDNQLLWCNPFSRQLLKIDRWQAGQIRLLLELVRSYELDRLIEKTRQAGESKVREWVFHATNVSPTERDRAISLRASSIPLPQGSVGIFLENQQPLIELAKARDRAFSDLTHELRTPLTSIRLVAENLNSRLQGTERTWVEKMLREINRLIDLVQNCLEISGLQQNPTENLTYESLDLKTLIADLWQTLLPLAQRKDLTLDYSGPDLLPFRGDRDRLIQVFLNILDNSIQYSPPQASIQVEVERAEQLSPTAEVSPVAPDLVEKNSWTIINIIDSGRGFQDSDLPHVFERLYRGELSRTRPSLDAQPAESRTSPSGSGLGLSIAQQIVQAHGGAIAARNHPVTGGAWLQIKLPNII